MNENNKIARGIFWKLLERFGVLGSQFLIQIILARLLEPSEYGALAIMMVFITIANVITQSGLNTALIQNKDVAEEDYSSVLWTSLVIAAIVYLVIFLIAPVMASVYNMDNIIWPLRTLSIILFFAALNSVQLAKVTREMNFKIIFKSNLVAVIASGTLGIACAYAGFGLWALVIQSIINQMTVCFVMFFSSGIHFQFKVNMKRIKVLFSYGWKLVVSSLLNSLTENIKGLTIGFKYDSSALGFYNRGMQFPQYISNVVQGTLQSVMFPAISEKQDSKQQAKKILKKSVSISMYISFPVMAGLAATSNSFVNLFLTEKWIECVPYIKIYCIIFAFFPLYVCNLQAISAMGRSDIFLKLEIIKQISSFAALFIALCCFDDPIAIAISGLCLIPIEVLLNCYPNKSLLGYSISEQMMDMLPSCVISGLMYVLVVQIERLTLKTWAILSTQICAGLVIYVFLSYISRIKPFLDLRKIVIDAYKKIKHKEFHDLEIVKRENNE